MKCTIIKFLFIYVSDHNKFYNNCFLAQEFKYKDDPQERFELLETIEVIKKEVVYLEGEENAKAECEKSFHSLQNKLISLEAVKYSDNFSFWTGFPNYQAFLAFYKFLQPRLPSLNIWRGSIHFQNKTLTDRTKSMRLLSTEEELFLTMVRLKTGVMVQMLAHCFVVSTRYVSQMATSYVGLMCQDLKEPCELPSYNTLADHISPAMKK